MNTLPKILICDDDSLIHLTIKHLLSKKFACFSAYNADEAISLLKKNTMNLLLLDIEIRSQEEGLKFIPKFKIIDPELPIIMISARMDFNSVREAMRLGAEDYVPKEFDEEDFLHTIHRVLDRKKIKQTKDQQTFEVTCHQKQNVLIGSSQAMQQVRKMIEKLRQSTAHVLISGETGTGKEVVARLLRGINEDGSFLPFVAVDSATIQSSTAESLLFGHEKGAFTGAEKTTKGIFEEANGGIVYFDEIANMPLEIQAKLLRVLQEKEISRLGSAKIVPLEFHV
ncbi:MAG: sigma-54-dependent Fis family transcriptional regulator, partial [Deltaproteobacteria bacterium]|nr:sigma-54-dependent Fis family transcriptional regulator [Deltaproteobacteria bacterium]